MWRFSTRLQDKAKCSARSVSEEDLQYAFLQALSNIVGSSDTYLDVLQQTLETAIRESNPESVENLDARMANLQYELIERIDRHENYDDLAEEIFRLREVREQMVMDDAAKKRISAQDP